ncbi:MAG TPA: hypothetical protein VHE14_05055, partial [Solirubrobacteraceae bacterium]|nr:hypothetical protein [Solirubrobacteraceae bacterium]
LDRLMYALDGIDLELVQTQILVALFGMPERVTERGAPLVEALSASLSHTNSHSNGHCNGIGAAPSPRPAYTPGPARGPLVMSPREAFLGPTECVPVLEAAGRVAAESLMAYPPGIPAVLPGERMTDEIVSHCREVLDRGGYLRGASDPTLRSVMVVADGHTSG